MVFYCCTYAPVHISTGNDNFVFKELADCICVERSSDVASCVEQVGNEALGPREGGNVWICCGVGKVLKKKKKS